MKWSIPAKTFLLGEYLALRGEAAILLTTKPCFLFSTTTNTERQGIHPKSPAGKFLQKSAIPVGCNFQDPYQGIGGMGASSAQFLGAYLTNCSLKQEKPNLDALLEAYYKEAWQGQGLRPSAYDIIAQSQQDCVYIDKNRGLCQSLHWSFPELSFILIHSGKKLATHEHLNQAALPSSMDTLIPIVESAKEAFLRKDSEKLIKAVNDYQQGLSKRELVATHSLQTIKTLKQDKDILAIKGCGALGADVLLLLVENKNQKKIEQKLGKTLASTRDLYQQTSLIENNLGKTLEISS